MDNLYGYTFHFNHHTGMWAAIPRGLEASYFNNMTDRIQKGIIFADDVNILIGFLSSKQDKKETD